MTDQPAEEKARISRDPDRTATISPHGQTSTNARELMAKRYRPVLLCLSGSQRGIVFKLEKQESVMGRGSDVEFILDDIRASRRHLKFIYENFTEQMDKPVCWVEDLNSRNGSELNGKKLVGKARLSDHDRIVVGKNVFGFYFRDESEILQQESLYETATRDKLTGLFNRHQTDLKLTEEVTVASAKSIPLSLIIIDIDRFKSINDNYGHAIGDDALRHVAKILEQKARRGDFVGRWGGEEFAIILPRTGAEAAIEQAEVLRLAIEEAPLITSEHTIRITASLGISVLTAKDTPETLFQHADRCLYDAKAGGRNRVIYKDFQGDTSESSDGPPVETV